MELEPDLPWAIDHLARAGWSVVVVSAGSSWYIDRLLKRAGVHLPTHANPGTFRPREGLFLELPRDSPFLSLQDGIDKRAVVADALSRFQQVAFAGNGPPDLAAAMLVESSLRFACTWLADELTRRGLPFHRFERWREVAQKLAEV